MLSREASIHALQVLFNKRPVADLEVLFEALDTRSRMSVFRRLKEVGYFSSFSHTGRYYTLAGIPDFDGFGLWRYQAIGFSQFGTLKSTVIHCIEQAEAGTTHAELEARLGLRVYNTLLLLARSGKTRREAEDGTFVYLSHDEERARQQLRVRRGPISRVVAPAELPSEDIVLLVVIEALRASDDLPEAAMVARRLVARGEDIAVAQVERIYRHFRLEPEKKTAEPR